MKSSRLSVGFLLLCFTLLSASAGTIVQFRTTLGDFDVELYDTDKPITVQNFLRYVQGGYYTNMFFHRVYTNGINIIQGGGFNVPDRGATNPTFEPVETFAAITNEFRVGKFYSNVFGTIAMAKTSDPNSATSQFFFNLADNSTALDDPSNAGGFTVFGHVITGTNVLNHFIIGGTNQLLSAADESFVSPVFSDLPVLYGTDPLSVTFDDLIYVDTSTLPPYTPVKATYTGLFTAPTNGTPGLNGFITLTTTTGTKYTGSLRLGASRYTFSGALDSGGYTITAAKASGQNPVIVRLVPDSVLGAEKLVGTITGTHAEVGLELYRAGFDARANPATNYTGKYTLTLAPSGQPGVPDGYGFAALSVNTAGSVTVKGTLADGTPLSQSLPLTREGQFPLYASLYAGGGYVSGWVSCTNAPGAELSGSLYWTKPATSKGAFLAAFATPLTAAGGRYTAPTPGVNLLSTTNSLAFGGDNTIFSFTNTVVLKTGNKLYNVSPNKLSISLTTASGLFSGSVTPLGATRALPFKGALWQNGGYGYFLSGTQSGWVLLQP